MQPGELAAEEASEVGYYLPDRYFMAVNRVDDNGGPDPLVVIHEYWHYLQNVSTLHGIKSFVTTQMLLPVFTKTMTGDGTSRGSGELTKTQSAHVEKYLRWRDVEEGDIGDSRKSDVRATVVDIRPPIVTFAVGYIGSTETVRRTLSVGARAIKESIAHIVERQYADLIGLARPKAPEFPYGVLERIVEFVVDRIGIPELDVAAIGTLSLLTHAPLRATIDLSTRYRDLVAAGESRSDALRKAGEEVALPDLREAVTVLRSDLESVASVHIGRGMLEKGIGIVVRESLRAIERRVAEPLFDLEPLYKAGVVAPIPRLTALMTEFYPCPMRHAGKMRTFRPRQVDEYGFDDEQYLMALHAQQHFMLSHAKKGMGTFCASSMLNIACPFVAACDHPNRARHAGNCERSPWKNYGDADTGCWYSEGVAASIGLKRVGRVEALPEPENGRRAAHELRIAAERARRRAKRKPLETRR